MASFEHYCDLLQMVGSRSRTLGGDRCINPDQARRLEIRPKHGGHTGANPSQVGAHLIRVVRAGDD